jgi:hypothetical protein
VDVPERIDHGSGDPPRFSTLGDRLALLGSHGQQPFEGGRHVVDVPAHDHLSWTARRALGHESPVDAAQLVLVVTDADLDMGRRALLRPDEVRLDAEQVRVPVLGRLQIVGPVADGGEPSQHLVLSISEVDWWERQGHRPARHWWPRFGSDVRGPR